MKKGNNIFLRRDFKELNRTNKYTIEDIFMPDKIVFNSFAEGEKSRLIKEIKENFQSILENEKLSKYIRDKSYSVQKELILKTLIQEFKCSDDKIKQDLIRAINIGFLSCSSGIIPRSQDKIFLKFIAENLLSSEIYHDYGIISLIFLLNDYSEYNTNLLLNQLEEDKRNLIYDSILRGLKDKVEIIAPDNFINEILANIKKTFSKTELVHYRGLFSKVFDNNKELLKNYLDSIIHFIEQNIYRIFIDQDVLTLVKPLYINFYTDEIIIFDKMDDYLQKNLDNPDYIMSIIDFISYFKTEHWPHPFYKKFYKQYFNLVYKFKERDDIHSIGIILNAFDYSSIINFNNGKFFDEEFFLKLLKDIEFEYRTNKSEILNAKYQFIESYLGLRPKSHEIKKISPLRTEKLKEFKSGFDECDFEINRQFKELKFFEMEITPNSKIWFEIIDEFFLLLHKCYDYPYYFRDPAQRWKIEPKDMSPWLSSVLLHRFRSRLKDKAGVSGGDSDHWIDEIPIEDKLLKTEEGLNQNNILEEKYKKHKDQVIREAGKSGFGVLCIADIRKEIKNNSIAAFPLTKCFHIYYENNIWIAVFLIQAFTRTPSKVKSK